MTLATLLQSLADRHDAGVLPTDSATLSLWKRLLNRGKDYCSQEINFEKSSTVTVSSGTGTLPSDFVTIGDVYLSTTPFSKRTPQEEHIGNVYWITGNENDGYKLNTLTDGSFTVTYICSFTDMSNTTDICPIPDGEAVVAFAYAMLRKSETDPLGDADKTLNECQSRIESMISDKRRNTTNIGFILP